MFQDIFMEIQRIFGTYIYQVVRMEENVGS